MKCRCVIVVLATLMAAPSIAQDGCSTVAECAQNAAEAAFQAKLALQIAVPRGAVMAFDLEDCPEGWTEYVEAYGRFVRGVDRGGNPVDPDGERKAGTHQADALQDHSHSVGFHSGLKGAGGGPHADIEFPGGTNNAVASTGGPDGARTATETRPANVALLYCTRE